MVGRAEKLDCQNAVEVQLCKGLEDASEVDLYHQHHKVARIPFKWTAVYLIVCMVLPRKHGCGQKQACYLNEEGKVWYQQRRFFALLRRSVYMV